MLQKMRFKSIKSKFYSIIYALCSSIATVEQAGLKSLTLISNMISISGSNVLELFLHFKH